MIDALIFMSQRPVVITLAVLGALLVTAGALAQKPKAARSISAHQRPIARRLTTSGYAITFASILLFIIAGFVSDLRP